MAKNTTKKIKELKVEKPEKITDAELNTLQATVRTIDRLTADVGRMEIQKHAIMHHISALQEAVGEIREEFEKDYGTADINIQDGVINYPKENGETDKED